MRNPQKSSNDCLILLKSNLSVQEKDEWIQKIQSKLGLVTRDSKREKELLAQIEAGAADIDDIV